MGQSNGDSEYEVETIDMARVAEKKLKTRRVRYWEYHVKWKGYGSEEDTWEPEESFNGGSEHFLERFWMRAKHNKEDVHDHSLFKVGQKVYPVGPPIRAKKSVKTSNKVDTLPSSSAHSPEKRKRDPDDAQIPSKRHRSRPTEQDFPTIRETSHSSGQQRKRSNGKALVAAVSVAEPTASDVLEQLDLESDDVSNEVVVVRQGYPPKHRPKEDTRSSRPPVSETRTSPSRASLPSHRARQIQPLVKQMELDVPSQMIQTKKDIIAKQSGSRPLSTAKVPSSRRRSSLSHLGTRLTVEKGVLKSVKSPVVVRQTERSPSPASKPEEVTDEIPVLDDPPPNGGELLELAGFKDAETLDPFEDPEPVDPIEPQQPAVSLFKSFTNKVTSKFPLWGQRPTIFGPLASGSSNSVPTAMHSQSFELCYDFTSVPLILSGTDLSLIETPHSPGHSPPTPPGRFYSQIDSHSLLNTVRVGGIFASVTLSMSATSDASALFDRFCARLHAGDLYTQMGGSKFLVFCSTDNTDILVRLNVPSNLSEIKHGIVMSSLTIENYSGYAEIAIKANNADLIAP